MRKLCAESSLDFLSACNFGKISERKPNKKEVMLSKLKGESFDLLISLRRINEIHQDTSLALYVLALQLILPKSRAIIRGKITCLILTEKLWP